MPVPTGPISEPLSELKGAIEGSSSFITQCAIDAVTPADQVVIHAYRPDLQGEVLVVDELPKPIVILRMENHLSNFAFPVGGAACSLMSGIIRMHFYDAYREATHQESVVNFNNFVGGVIQDLSSNLTWNLGPTQISQVQPAFCQERRDGTSTFGQWLVEFDISYGNSV